MAGVSFIVCSPLCFIRARFGRLPIGTLKSCLLDFYSPSVLVETKKQLLSDIRSLDLSGFPHIPDRRDSESHANRVVDDIFSALTYLDEQCKLSLLPSYVADSPDSMPSTRLYDGDMLVLLKKYENMEKLMADFDLRLTAMFNEVKATGVALGGASGAKSNSVGSSSQPQPSTSSAVVQLAQRVPKTAVTSDVNNDIRNQQQNTTQSQMDWASVATSSPFASQNRFGVLETDGESDAAQFTDYHSRRSKRRRLPTSSPQQQQQMAGNQQHKQQQQQRGREDGSYRQQQQHPDQYSNQQRRRRGGRLLKGSASNVRGLVAAKHIVDKAVFCVDNVNPSLTPDDLAVFVRSMSVSVISCFRTAPRRFRGESGPITDRAAFRLCIAAADRQRLLDDSQWPESVIISEWFYIKPTADRRQRAAQPAVNMGESETEMERRSSSVMSVPLSPSSSTATYREVPAAGDVADGSLLVATTSSLSSLSSSAAVGTRATDHTSASTSDSGDGDATLLYNSNGLSIGDVAV